MPNELQPLQNLLDLVQSTALAIGGTTFVISVIVAGIMRMTSFANERRVSMSNMALTAAVVGLVIMVLSTAIHTFITGGLTPPPSPHHP